MDEVLDTQPALAHLTVGTLIVKQLAIRARYLVDMALLGADQVVKEQLLWALPWSLAQEVERAPWMPAQWEMERQQALVEEDAQVAARPGTEAAATVWVAQADEATEQDNGDHLPAWDKEALAHPLGCEDRPPTPAPGLASTPGWECPPQTCQ